MNRSKLYLIVQTVLCVALAVLLATSAFSIYREGAARKALSPLESIYTPEIAAGRFAPIAPLFFASLGLLVAGLLLGIKDENTEKPVKDAASARDLAVTRVSRPSEAMLREQTAQRRLTGIGWGVFILCMVPVALYLADATHFPAFDPESMFLGLIRVFLPCGALGMGALAVTAALREKSILRETQAATARIREEKAEGVTRVTETPGPQKGNNARILRVALLVAAVVLIVAGILNGSARDVLYKAITICTECVGLG
ncbi:MAG: hypothetical protein IJ719_08780 [Clostridia bacterium]|nr:hypothetical protein [Clostridia bacterium]